MSNMNHAAANTLFMLAKKETFTEMKVNKVMKIARI